MHIALVADVFPPARSSGAVQLRDLSLELVVQGHKVTVLTPDPELNGPWAIEKMDGVEVVRLRAFRTRDTSYLRRTLAELAMPYLMRRNFASSPFAECKFDGVVWYSPSIFMGPLVNWLKQGSKCRSYLILRDIFPEWAADMGLMGKGVPFRFFQAIANYQYSVADVIGVQTPGNTAFFEGRPNLAGKIEILHNWLATMVPGKCSIDISSSKLAGRRIFVYAGNMGVAQGMPMLIELAELLQDDPSIGFVFVGRGSDVPHLVADAKRRGLQNVLFFDEIDPDEIAGLYAQAHIGLVALDPRHRTHNIPGKFISYMHCGLPVFAIINPHNDLGALIAAEDVGVVCTDRANTDLRRLAYAALELDKQEQAKERCRHLARELFSAQSAASRIVSALSLPT